MNSDWAEVPATQSGVIVVVLVDLTDVAYIGARKLSIGSHGYAQINVPTEGRCGLLHRMLLGLQRGDGLIGDHRNGNRLDCRRSNLRIVNPSASSANTSAHGKTGFRGVYVTVPGRYEARAKVDGRSIRLGTFDTPEAADAVAHAWRIAHMPGYIDRPGARRAAERPPFTPEPRRDRRRGRRPATP